MRRVLGWRVNRFQWQRVTLFSSVDACTYTRCGDRCVQFRPPPLFFSRVRDARSRRERNRLVLLSSRRSPLSRRGSYPLVTEGNNRHSGRISSLWGCAVSAMVADLRFIRNAFRRFSPTASILLPTSAARPPTFFEISFRLCFAQPSSLPSVVPYERNLRTVVINQRNRATREASILAFS